MTARLLWILRNTLELKRTGYDCCAGLCGACTIHANGQPIRSCSYDLYSARGVEITTVEGLVENRHPIEEAWGKVGAPHCPYCKSGRMMTITALLAHTPYPTEKDIQKYVNNLCNRCQTAQDLSQIIQ